MFKFNTKTKIFPVAICLIAYLFAWTNAASANILCFGSDGHIAIEKTYGDSCGLDLAANDCCTKFIESREISVVNATDTCTDTTVPFSSLNKKFSSDSDNHFIAVEAKQDLKYQLEYVEPKQKASIHSRDLRNQNLDILKTVILTI